MNPEPRYKLIIFDWNGTLSNAMDADVDYSDVPPLYKGVKALLKELNQAGCLLALATHMPFRSLLIELECHDIAKEFVAFRCIDQYPSKPNPEMITSLMEFTGVDAAQTLMVGDTAADLQMASNAKVDSVGVTYGLHDADSLLTYLPSSLINDIAELKEIIFI